MGYDTNSAPHTAAEFREKKNIQEQDNDLFRVHMLKAGLFQFTDATNAERLMEKYGTDIRYVPEWKKWLVWNGSYWKVDEGALIHQKGLEMIRSIYDEILKTVDYHEKDVIEKAAIQSESMRRREAFIKAASLIPKLNIEVADLDKDPFLLNVKNGTIQVTTGEFRKHRQEDFITKMANVSYEPAADCPLWEQFIREIMEFKGGLVSFWQTALGWGITGDTSEQVMFILIGNGANGKNTCINVIMHVLGDYATSTPTETFMRRQGDGISNDIAWLRGMHFVATTEAEQGRRLSESLIKQITGNDRMTARFLYGKYFDFFPTFKIFMATNHKPTISRTDHGIWRRIRTIPFNTTIDETKRDLHLGDKLIAESSGILNWLIKGAMRWKAEGLAIPAEVKSATDEYREEMDIIGSFIKDRCEQKPGARIRSRELFKCYQDWCEENNEHACSEKFFGMRLKELGIGQKRTSEARHWVNITVKE
ncbi:phage/plasmid primase, P4 family [Treponema primitia]|uniref:DNA primase family protein n=1 Tax=Treponema primitia TaxID=88058 RepID=UPI0039812CEE